MLRCRRDAPEIAKCRCRRCVAAGRTSSRCWRTKAPQVARRVALRLRCIPADGIVRPAARTRASSRSGGAARVDRPLGRRCTRRRLGLARMPTPWRASRRVVFDTIGEAGRTDTSIPRPDDRPASTGIGHSARGERARAPGDSMPGPTLLTAAARSATGNRRPLDPVLDQLDGEQKLAFAKAQAFDFAAITALPSITIRPTLEYDRKQHALSRPSAHGRHEGMRREGHREDGAARARDRRLRGADHRRRGGPAPLHRRDASRRPTDGLAAWARSGRSTTRCVRRHGGPALAQRFGSVLGRRTTSR